MTRPPPKKIAGLFENWSQLETRDGTTMIAAIERLNEACGTQYRGNWPHKMAAAGFALERIPLTVRCYMMRVVLLEELHRQGIKIRSATLDRMVRRLT